ncbi:MAG: lipoyl(octanoyl) transferase LipB [Buchnera aphidicola (Nurudea yanoniella)]
MTFKVKIRNLGLRDINVVSNYMRNFTITRNKFSTDEVWLVQHYPIFTFGVSEHKYNWIVPQNISIIFSDRGGKTTYHGPGQLIAYFLIDLVRRKLTVKNFILLLQNIILSTLRHFSIYAYILNEFPGIYINNKKICSFGLRIKKGCSLYGIALNIDMDLSPFNYIYPCGNNFKMTQVIDIKPHLNFKIVQLVLIKNIKKYFI